MVKGHLKKQILPHKKKQTQTKQKTKLVPNKKLPKKGTTKKNKRTKKNKEYIILSLKKNKKWSLEPFLFHPLRVASPLQRRSSPRFHVGKWFPRRDVPKYRAPREAHDGQPKQALQQVGKKGMMPL